MMRNGLRFASICLFSTSALAATTVGPEIHFDTAGTSIAAPGLQTGPVIAQLGGTYLVAWTDAERPSSSGRDVYAARVTAAGALLAGPVLLTTTAGDFHDPRVATDGTNFLVVWAGDGKTYGVRVTPAGEVLDPRDHLITAAFEPEALAGSPGGYLLLGLHRALGGGDPDLLALRVTTAGVAVESTPITLAADDDGRITDARAAFDGENFAVVWSYDPDLFDQNLRVLLGRISPAGAKLDSPPAILAMATDTGDPDPQIACAAGSCVTVLRRRVDVVTGIHAVRTTGATLQDPPTLLLAGSEDGSRPTIARRASDFLVTWMKGAVTHVARVSPERVVAGEASLTNEPALAPVASDGTAALVVWDTGADVKMATVGADGAIVPPVAGTLLSVAAPEQRLTAASSGGGQSLAVWLEAGEAPGSQALVGARVAADGTLLDPAGIRLIEAVDTAQPAVAFGGGAFLAAANTADRQGITFVRVSPAGVVLDATPGVAHLAGATELAAAFDGAAFVVVATVPTGFREGDILAARIAAGGDVLVDSFTVNADPGPRLFARIASNGAGALVVWTDDRMIADGPYDRSIRGVRLDADGDVVPGEVVVAPFTHFLGAPAVASDGTDYLVAWGDARGAVPGPGIYASRVSASGVVSAPGGTQIADGTLDLPALVHMPGGYLAAWRTSARDAQLAGRFVSADAQPLGAAIALAAQIADGSTPALADDDRGHALVVYSRVDPAPEYGSERARARTVTITPDIDAGVADAAVVTSFDARVAPDAAITSPPDDDDDGCSTGGSRGRAELLGWMVLAVALLLARASQR